MARYTHAIYRTAFHGGGLVSRHRSERTAELARTKLRRGLECQCGCYVVVPVDVDLPTAGAARSPRAPARWGI